MKIVVLDGKTLGVDIDLSPLYEIGEVVFYENSTQEEACARVEDAEAVLTNKLRIDRALLDRARNLRIVTTASTGYDQVDLKECRRRGIAVANVVGYSTESVAQVTVAMVLSLLTHLSSYAAYTADGTYTAGGIANILTPVYHEIAGKTWGIVGQGNIGRRVGQVASALGCRVFYAAHRTAGEEGTLPLDELCAVSDILTLHVPLNDSTRGLISRDRIGKCKRGVCLVNAARGAVTDEAAVAEAVLSGQIGAFGCDVYTVEPFPTTHPYTAVAGLPNVLLTPHMAWGAYEARNRCIREVAENIRAFLGGIRRCRVD